MAEFNEQDLELVNTKAGANSRLGEVDQIRIE